ncbi:MAG: ABC transporter ATP-binding protein [Bacteroidota bacterium]|jgi:subfamily B ATP-binding cassette protein MsbA
MKKIFFDNAYWKLIQRFILFLSPHRRLWLASLGLMLVSLLLTLPMPWISMKAIDKAITNGDASLFLFLIVGWTLVIVLRTFLSYAQGKVGMKFQLGAGQSVRDELVEHVLHLPMTFFMDKQVGYLITRIFQDAEESVSLLGGRIIGLVSSMLGLVFGIFIVFIINWKLALLSLAIVPFLLINQAIFKHKIRAKELLKRETWARVAGKAQESLTGISSVKIYTTETHEVGKFHKYCLDGMKKSLDTWQISQISRSIGSIIQGMGPILIFAYAGSLIVNKQMTVGELIGFAGYMGMLFGPASNLFDFILSSQNAVVALQRIYQILDEPPEEYHQEFQSHTSIKDFAGNIKFENVHFSYPGSPKNVLLNLNIEIVSGESVAIVGGSGAGKTTLINLLLRLYTPQKGTIYIDDVDISTLPLSVLRQLIRVVPQEPFLFTGSIKENIVWGNLTASEEEIEQAANAANIHKFITSLPLGYATELGEHGYQLSGGQKQLISMARAFLRNPRIIILDEATSAVDSQSEQLVKEAMKRLLQKRTSLVISHRLSSIVNVKRILVLENSQIVEEGTHRKLYHKRGAYQRLFEEQLHVMDRSNA